MMSNSWTIKRVLVWGAGFLLVAVIVGYALYQFRAIIAGPEIILTSPQNGITSTSSLITVSGVARHVKEITLDGRSIFIDLKGNFREQLLLMPGYNIIELTARDVEGREQKKAVELVYRPE